VPVIALVVGARPNYIKAKPILARLEAATGVEAVLVHTGQHYDPELCQALFSDLCLRDPDVYLGAEERDRRLSVPAMATAFHAWCRKTGPDAVIVVGDVDSTAACALGAYHCGVPVVHVEAGLRSGDRAMPEEINRIVTDAVSGLLLVSDPAGVENLAREGRGSEDVKLVGNVMIDTLLERLPAAREVPLRPSVRDVADGGPFALLTLHRPSNVDAEAMLRLWAGGLERVGAKVPILWPVHPRTAKSIERHGLEELFAAIPHLTRTGPVGYLETIALEERATLIMTDSGGVTEEASVLDTPCLTLRTTTERPLTVSQGTCVLVGETPDRLVEEVDRILAGQWDKHGEIPLWDGQAAQRIVGETLAFLRRLESAPSSAE
jgi:UDP-N-acetylglucosamine 2-epimerase (non-hydrolysing)